MDVLGEECEIIQSVLVQTDGQMMICLPLVDDKAILAGNLAAGVHGAHFVLGFVVDAAAVEVDHGFSLI